MNIIARVMIFLATYLIQHERNPICIDTDPATLVFSSFLLFKAEHFNLVDEDSLIDSHLFNDLMRQLLVLDGDSDVVVDTEASNYIALLEYLQSVDPFTILKSAGQGITCVCI